MHGLHLRARFVGPAIFMPHLSLLDVPTNDTCSAGNQTLLLASFCPPIAGSFSVDLRVLWWSPNPPSEERQVFLGAREGAGTNRKHHEIFLRCEAASRLPMRGPLVVAPAVATAQPLAMLPPCNSTNSGAGHWRRLPTPYSRRRITGEWTLTLTLTLTLTVTLTLTLILALPQSLSLSLSHTFAA